MRNSTKNFELVFWLKFEFLTKNWIFGQNLNFWPKFEFLTKIWIFDQNLNFWTKFEFLTKIWIFDQNLNFWPKFEFLPKIWIFQQNFQIVTQISIFDQNLDFWRKTILKFNLWYCTWNLLQNCEKNCLKIQIDKKMFNTVTGIISWNFFLEHTIPSKHWFSTFSAKNRIFLSFSSKILISIESS